MKLNKERVYTGFYSAVVKQFFVSVQALLLVLSVCKSSFCFVRGFNDGNSDVQEIDSKLYFIKRHRGLFNLFKGTVSWEIS